MTTFQGFKSTTSDLHLASIEKLQDLQDGQVARALHQASIGNEKESFTAAANSIEIKKELESRLQS